MFIQPCLNCLVSVLSFKILSILFFAFPQTLLLLVTSHEDEKKTFFYIFYYKNDSFLCSSLFFWGMEWNQEVNEHSKAGFFFSLPTSQSDYRVILINSFSRFYWQFFLLLKLPTIENGK